VNLDLTALPVDVDALHRLVRELAAQVADDDTQLAAARAEGNGCGSSSDACNGRSLVGGRNGSMVISLLSGWKISTPMSRGRRPRIGPLQSIMPRLNLPRGARPFQITCHART